MLLQVFFRLDIALVAEFGWRHLFAIDFYVSTTLPVAQHLSQGTATHPHPLAQVVRFLAGKHLGQLVEQVLRAPCALGVSPFLLLLDGLAKELHLAPQVVIERPPHKVLHGLVPLLAVCHV